MKTTGISIIPSILEKDEAALLDDWLTEQSKVGDPIPVSERKDQCTRFLHLLRDAAQGGRLDSAEGPQWQALKAFLAEVSRYRIQEGLTPSEIAKFVYSFKKPLFSCLRREIGTDAQKLADETWRATEILDSLGLYTTEVFQKVREETIARQQQEMLELSTPVVQLWPGVLALPIIGTLDSARTQIVMESLLNRIVETGSQIAIVDITGVPTVDTLVAQHLLKTVTAARLMGADCIISGIRPSIAQTIVHLGVDLAGITTKASLADALLLALDRIDTPNARALRQSTEA